MEAGKLRRPIKIKEPIDTPDGMGGFTTVWTDVHETRAAIEPMTGKEILYAGERQSETKVKITIRYRSGIQAAWRVYDGNEVYDINSVSDMFTTHHVIELTCTRLGSENKTVTVNTPTITSPADAAVDFSVLGPITSSAFAVTGGTDTHHSTQLQIATTGNPDFGTVLFDLSSTTEKTSVAIPAGILSNSTEYLVRVKYTSTASGSSAWSATTSFTTEAA